jgi:RNAse (barnase) inhibitor barstar
MKRVYEIDGYKFNDLQEFYEHISQILIPGIDWGRNLDAFNDILRGGFGTPKDGFVIKWKNSARSREVLGYAETVKYIEQILTTCHPLNRAHVQKDLEAAQAKMGMTLFTILVEIIEEHGQESGDGVELELL